MRLLACVLVSLMLLSFVQPPVAPSDPVDVATVPRIETKAEVLADVSEPVSPFAYVQTDGTLEYLPATGEGAYLEPPSQSGLEDVHAGSGFLDPMKLESAVYRWSVPAETRITP